MVFTRPTWLDAAVWFEAQMALVAGMLLTIAVVWQGLEYMFGRFDHDPPAAGSWIADAGPVRVHDGRLIDHVRPSP